MKPKVSVIIPTFNREHVLQRAVESVLEQDFKDFELLIIDDGSRDKTIDVCPTSMDSITCSSVNSNSFAISGIVGERPCF